MRTKEELNSFKGDIETVSKKLAELNEEDLTDVCGGNTEDMSGMVDRVMEIMKMLDIDVSRERVIDLIKCGGSTLRDFAKAKSNNNHLANLIPEF